MLIKKTLALAILASLPIVANANSFTAKRAAQGFTGVTGDFTAALDNPALLTRYKNNDDFYLSLNLGVIASDKDELIDRGERVGDELEKLIDDINDETATIEQAEQVLAEIEDLDGRLAFLKEGINVMTIFPNEMLSWGVYVNQYGKGGATINYVDSDGDLIRDAIINGNTLLEIKNNNFDISTPENQARLSDLLISLGINEFDLNDLASIDLNALEDAVRRASSDPQELLLDPDDLQSQGLALGYSVAEVGINLGREVIRHVKFDLSLGAAIKYQRLDVIDYRVGVQDFDEDSFDASEYVNDTGHINADIGAHLSWGEQRYWQAGLVVRNLNSQKLTSVNNVQFNLDTSATLGVGYDNELFSVAVDWDISDRESFDRLKPVKFLAVGTEFDFWQHGQLRAGYRKDLNDVEESLYTVGLGISPWDVLAMDISVMAGENDTLGAAIQFGLKL